MPSARAFALQRHGDQKYGDGKPYIVHLEAVAENVKKWGWILKIDALVMVDLVNAALLHDVLEDTPTTREELSETFNPQVAELVWRVSNEAGVNRKERHRLTHVKTRVSKLAVFLKLMDRISNVEEFDPRFKKMYRKEHAGFKESLYLAEDDFDEIWDYLKIIVERE